MTDQAIAEDFGSRLKRIRLSKEGSGITQAELARRAGVNRSTVVAMEQGRGKLEMLIPILRALDALDVLDNIAAPAEISPLELARRQGGERRRAATVRADQANKTADSAKGEW